MPEGADRLRVHSAGGEPQLPKRLSFDGYDGSKPVAIPGVKAPLETDGRACSLARVLEIALDHAGLALGYDAIMGLSGLAFETPPWPETPIPSTSEFIRAIEAMSDALGGCITVYSGDLPSKDRVLDTVATAIDAGRPCVAFGWGSNKDRWSVIAGYDRAKGRLLGHCVLPAPREKYESWPPTLTMLAALTGEPRPRGPDAITSALEDGAQRCREHAVERYRKWAEELRVLPEPPGSRHEQAVELLADARAAAAGFAERVADREEIVPAAWLTRAAEQWRELVLMLESRGVPHSQAALNALADPDGREDWANLLQMAARREERAARAIQKAWSADYPPEEAVRG